MSEALLAELGPLASALAAALLPDGDSRRRGEETLRVAAAEPGFCAKLLALTDVRSQLPDVVRLLAASGATPYVLGALQEARKAGALTIGFANNPDAPLTEQAEIGILLDTGAEVISGSTRLKAGSAQKMALNSFSSALMVRLNKVYGNLMVDLKPTNAKLLRRALALTLAATGADPDKAAAVLQDCGFHVKVAIVALRKHINVAQARSALDAAGGSVRQALNGS